MKVRYSARASRDLAAIHEYLSDRSPRGASNVMAAIFATIEFIRRNPEAAPDVARMPGVRGIIVRRYRFKVFLSHPVFRRRR
jgi:plasmid stabilization system protein ParE